MKLYKYADPHQILPFDLASIHNSCLHHFMRIANSNSVSSVMHFELAFYCKEELSFYPTDVFIDLFIVSRDSWIPILLNAF